MKRPAGLALDALCCVLLAGCGAPSSTPAAPPSSALAPEPIANFPVPSANPSGDLALLLNTGRSSGRIRVGDSANEFRSLLPRPPSVPRAIQDLPPQIPAGMRNYSVWGWEYDDRSRGAGTLLYEDRVAVAMRQLESLQPSEIDQELAAYRRVFGIPREVEGPRVHYWFWQTNNVTLMVCAYKTGEGGQNLTEAVGDSAVMDALGMSPLRANAQKEVLGRILNRPVQSDDVMNPG